MPETEEPNQSVTVIDSDPNVRKHIDYFLSAAGFSVSFEPDGYTALDKLRSAPTDFVITEILIPRLDGLALSRLLKSDPATESIKILIFSLMDTEERALRSGANAFIKKPFEPTRLLACLRSMNETQTRQVPVLHGSDA